MVLRNFLIFYVKVSKNKRQYLALNILIYFNKPEVDKPPNDPLNWFQE